MLDLNDDRWNSFTGGYRVQFDPRPLLVKLEAGNDIDRVWRELWQELYHQGDVGEASYAAVPHLVRIHRQRGVVDWNTYSIVGIVELARGQRNNPEVPKWLQEDYFTAIKELAQMGAAELQLAKTPEEIRSILGVLAIEKGARTHGRFLLEYSEEELLDFESRE